MTWFSCRANGRLNQVDDSGKFKPDYIAFVKIRSTRHDLTIAEMKPTGASSSRLPSDLVKLGQQMKVMLNKLIGYIAASPVVCGILVEGEQKRFKLSRHVSFILVSIGKNCSLYEMDIIAQRFYCMVLLTSFPLCTSPSEFCLIPNMLLCMAHLKVISNKALICILNLKMSLARISP